MTHIPGPWAQYGKLVQDTPQTVGGWLVVRAVDIPAAPPKIQLYGRTVALTERADDARLIAAAPRLLAVLKELVGAIERYATSHGAHINASDMFDAAADARAAIAQAEPPETLVEREVFVVVRTGPSMDDIEIQTFASRADAEEQAAHWREDYADAIVKTVARNVRES